MLNPGIWILVVTGVILLAELLAGRHHNRYTGNDYLVNGLCIALGVTVRPMLAAVVGTAIRFALPAGRDALQGVPFLPALVAIVLLAEFANYWVHRWSHKFEGNRYLDWLWRLHRTHHTAKYVNVLLTFRVNLFWGVFSGLTWVVSLAIYLGQGTAAGVAIVAFSLYGIVTHSDFRWDDTIRRHRVFGPAFRALEHVFVSPGIHHSHHGYGRDGGNYRNFGVFLSLYDWLFGTLHIPEGRPSRYGIPRPTPHWAEEVFFPLYWRRAPAGNGAPVPAGRNPQ